MNNRTSSLAVLVCIILCYYRSLSAEAKSTDPLEVYVLKQVKTHLGDPYGNLKNWVSGDPCMVPWTGVLCSMATAADGYLHLERLQLFNMDLTGNLAPEIGILQNLTILDFMWNNISGSIPREIGNMTSLKLLLLNGNQLSGPLPEELGYLDHLNRLQIDLNNISGPIPKSFGNLKKALHLHMNNNSLSGQIPKELSKIPELVHLLLDNNNLTGKLPPELGNIPKLEILQLDNNHLTDTVIPKTFVNMTNLLKLLLDNNQLTGFALSDNGSSISFNSTGKLVLDLRKNNITDINHFKKSSPNITLRLDGNPVCSQVRIYDIYKHCSTGNGGEDACGSSNNNNTTCGPYSCSSHYYGHNSNSKCFSPLIEVGYRLKSPTFSFFPPYIKMFGDYLTSELNLDLNQLSIASYSWSPGPRLEMNLKIFSPQDRSHGELNQSQILQIQNRFTAWNFERNKILGPYEYLNFTSYKERESGLSKSALVGILIGAIFGTAVVTSIIMMMIFKQQKKYREVASRKKFLAKERVKVAGVKDFDFDEMTLATNNFSVSMQIGQGGYGRVYKGLLKDGTVVAIKRAREGSLQGGKEFSNEIELLSRLHHRNLVSLLGYCDDQGEQMLVYEYMPNGTLHDHLAGKFQLKPLDFALRLRIALGSARGILYLHNEANPPIFHRDIKASNILLDDKFNARVADFGLSRLALLPDIEGSAPDHVSTVVKGTPGYLDPEYFLTHQLTDKSDVYSFGVVLFELLTGMEPISHGKNIVREVKMAYESGSMLSMIDKRLGSYPSECLEPFASLALRCCRDETDARPAVAEVVQELEKILQLMPPEGHTLSIESHIYPMGIERTEMDISAENPFISSDISGSNLLSGNIPGVAPR